QAEDGIRDRNVTGVQTCALPICIVYCAYHGNFDWNGNDVKYAAMPHDIDFFDCNALNGSPNDDPAADAEVNTLAHETEETNTDEDLNAWYDNSGNENADKCEIGR